jgi:hypothetical protein
MTNSESRQNTIGILWLLTVKYTVDIKYTGSCNTISISIILMTESLAFWGEEEVVESNKRR